MTTPQSLLAAYVTASGLTLTLTYSRQMSLTQLCEMGMTETDMTMVIQYIQKQIKMGTKGFTFASLDFRNAVADVEKFEETCQRLRQEALRKRPVPKQVAEVRNDGNGACSRLVEQPQPEPKVIDLRASLINLASNLKAS